MAAGSVALVPTLSISDLILPFFQQMLSRQGLEEVRGWLKTHAARVAQAHTAGVNVLAGTDGGMTPHGAVAREVRLLLEAGLPAEASLGAASWRARAYLGMPGIEEGAPADIVVFEADPIADPNALRRPALIILNGRVVGKTSPAASR